MYWLHTLRSLSHNGSPEILQCNSFVVLGMVCAQYQIQSQKCTQWHLFVETENCKWVRHAAYHTPVHCWGFLDLTNQGGLSHVESVQKMRKYWFSSRSEGLVNQLNWGCWFVNCGLRLDQTLVYNTVHVCTSMSMYIYIYVYIHTYIYVCTYVCMYVRRIYL